VVGKVGRCKTIYERRCYMEKTIKAVAFLAVGFALAYYSKEFMTTGRRLLGI
jgi:hypothetical protein